MKKMQASLPGSELVNTEQSIMATFDFLGNENVDDDEDDDEDDDGMTNGDSHDGPTARTTTEQLLAHANRFKVHLVTWPRSIAEGTLISEPLRPTEPSTVSRREMKRGKKEGKSIYILPFILSIVLKRLDIHGSHSFTCKFHHACLSFVSGHKMAPPLTEVADIQLQLTTYLSTPKGERLSWPGWLTYSGQSTHINGHPSATGRAQDGESLPAKDRRSTTVPHNQYQLGR